MMNQEQYQNQVQMMDTMQHALRDDEPANNSQISMNHASSKHFDDSQHDEREMSERYPELYSVLKGYKFKVVTMEVDELKNKIDLSYRMRERGLPTNIKDIMRLIDSGGTLEPITCIADSGSRDDTDKIHIIDGYSRLYAAQNRGLKTILVAMVDTNVASAINLSIRLNIRFCREMSKADRTHALIQLWNYHLSQNNPPPTDVRLSRLFGVQDRTISKWCKENGLYSDERLAIRQGKEFVIKTGGIGFNTSQRSVKKAKAFAKEAFPTHLTPELWRAPFMLDPHQVELFQKADIEIQKEIVNICTQSLNAADNEQISPEKWETLNDARSAVKKKKSMDAIILRRQSAQGKFQDNFFCGDCREILPRLPDHSVRLLLLDNPYGVAIGGSHRATMYDKSAIEGDESLPVSQNLVNETFDSMPSKLMPDSHILMFCSKDNFIEWRSLLLARGYDYRDQMIWDKLSPGNTPPERTSRCYEIILHFTQGNPPVMGSCPDVLRYERDLERAHLCAHATPKSVRMLRKLIEFTTVANELVCDPFAGSGSTILAARELGRRYFAVELNSDRYLEAVDEIERAKEKERKIPEG